MENILSQALSYLEKIGRQPVDRRWTARDHRYLTGPLVVYPGWDDTPQWLREAVRIARLALILAGEEEHASEEEAVVYLMMASLTAPLDNDWAEIYLWLAARVLKRWGRWERPDPDFVSIRETLWPHQQDDLDRLLRDIRRSVERHAKNTITQEGVPI